jgi:hypothetical protein
MEVLIPITFFISFAAVLILRPVTKRLGGLLETASLERREVGPAPETEQRTLALLEQVNRRLELIEDRLDFTERLVANGRPARAALSDSDAAAPRF